jgi:agmatine deiminase
MPAEWEPHAATWIAWPHNRDDWPGKFAAIPWVYGELVRHLHRQERVRILVQNTAEESRAKRVLRQVGVDLAQVDFFRFPTDRSWTRDFCPSWIKREGGERALVNWKFNGWAKYPNYKRDDAVTDRVARALKLPQWKPELDGRRIVMEGGALDVNGAGTLMATEECLLSPVQARNPGVAREDLERVLGEHLGIRKVLWLKNGIAGDDTHGHVDDLARFVGPSTVLVAQEDDPRDANHAPLRENRALLESMTDQDGRKLSVVPLPMPAPLAFNGQRVPASYANFYVANGTVLVPTFNDPKDRVALGIIAELFPGRAVAGIHAVDLVWGLGTLHCMTQQEPA